MSWRCRARWERFIACMAADIVLADATPLVAAEVIRVDAVETFAAADETFLAAGAFAVMALGALRLPGPAGALRVGFRVTALRVPGPVLALRVPVAVTALRVPVAVTALRVALPAGALLPAMTFGRLAAVMDTLLPTRRARTISGVPP